MATSKSEEDQVPIASAYAVVPNEEEMEERFSPAIVDDPRLRVDHPLGTRVSQEFDYICEAQNLTWHDDFFEHDEDVIAVFDFDYDNMERHYRTLGWGFAASTVLCFPGSLFWCLVGMVPCYLNKNVTWSVRAKHLAVTPHGIVLVNDRRPCLWGEQCAVAKLTKTIPFDQIINCTVTDLGAGTCSIGPTLSQVTIDTPARNTIVGLQDPHAFAKLVLAMKRYAPNQVPLGMSSTRAASLPVAMAQRIDRGLAAGEKDEVAGILKEIRDELRQHNELLKTMKPPHANTTA